MASHVWSPLIAALPPFPARDGWPAVDLDPVELHDARQAILPEKELNAVEQLQRAYGDKYRPLAMLDSKRKASGLLHEYADEQAVQKLKQAQQQKIQSEHTPPKSKKKRIDFER